MHFEAIVVFIVIEIHIRFPISPVDIIELISITMRDDVSKTTQLVSSSIVWLVAEAASNEGMNLVVVSLINIR